MKKITVFIVSIFFLFLFTETVQAKVLPQSAKQTKVTVGKGTLGAGISVSPRLRADRKALNVRFSNLQNATSVSYQLIYKTSTQDEGAMGGLNLKGSSSQSVELLFGTCSKNVCRYHTGIHDARLEVSYTSKSGKKYLKKYKIKI